MTDIQTFKSWLSLGMGGLIDEGVIAIGRREYLLESNSRGFNAQDTEYTVFGVLGQFRQVQR